MWRVCSNILGQFNLYSYRYSITSTLCEADIELHRFAQRQRIVRKTDATLQVFTAMKVFWLVTPCYNVVGEPCSLHLKVSQPSRPPLVQKNVHDVNILRYCELRNRRKGNLELWIPICSVISWQQVKVKLSLCSFNLASRHEG
jgi:hypothetical protein